MNSRSRHKPYCPTKWDQFLAHTYFQLPCLCIYNYATYSTWSINNITVAIHVLQHPCDIYRIVDYDSPKSTRLSVYLSIFIWFIKHIIERDNGHTSGTDINVHVPKHIEFYFGTPKQKVKAANVHVAELSDVKLSTPTVQFLTSWPPGLLQHL